MIESEVAKRKRIGTRNLEAHVSAHAHPNGARLEEIELDAWKQMLERAAAARERLCVCRACGVPGRGTGPSGSASRSNTMTFSKWAATAFAAARPPIPAPITTACFRIGLTRAGLPMIAMLATKISAGREAERTVSTVTEPRYRRISGIGFALRL